MKTVLQLDKLTQSEKLRAMEELWEDLSRNEEDFVSPEWHGEVLREREEALNNGEDKFVPWEEAKKTLDTLKVQAPKNPHLYYNLACYYSLIHQEKESLQALQKSFQLGYKSRGDVQSDPDLANLRQTPEFQQWVKTR